MMTQETGKSDRTSDIPTLEKCQVPRKVQKRRFRVWLLHLQRYPIAEIAGIIKASERTVFRDLAAVREEILKEEPSTIVLFKLVWEQAQLLINEAWRLYKASSKKDKVQVFSRALLPAHNFLLDVLEAKEMEGLAKDVEAIKNLLSSRGLTN